MTTKKKRRSSTKKRRSNPKRRRHTTAAAAPRRRRRRHNPALFAPKRKKHHARRRKHGRRRRNPDGIVMDFLKGTLAGVAANIAVDLALKKFGGSLDPKMQAGVRIAVGGAAAFALANSHPAIGLGIAAAVAAPAARGFIQPMLPAQLQALDSEEGGFYTPIEGVLDPRELGMAAIVDTGGDGMSAVIDTELSGLDDDDDDFDDFD